jgi:hypothetical protein
MRYVKFLILNIVVFGSLFFGISLLFPSKNRFAKSVNVPVAKQRVQQILLNTSGWQQWNLLIAAESDIKQITTDTTSLHFATYQKEFAFYAIPQDSLSTTLNCIYTEHLPWYNPLKKYAAMVNNKSTAWLLDTSLTKLKLVATANLKN